MPRSKTFDSELKRHDFRVAIFGSARVQKNDKIYKHVFKLAKEVGRHHFDIVTGGGPGLMEAANAGHASGDPNRKSDNIGLAIELPWEAKTNKHLEIKRQFSKFSKRLDNFMALSSVAIIVPGGIGTCLELFYTWQLIQVKHIHPIPIILVGEMWEKLIRWVQKYPLKEGLVSPADMDCIHICANIPQAMKVIMKAHQEFVKKNAHDNNGYLAGKTMEILEKLKKIIKKK